LGGAAAATLAAATLRGAIARAADRGPMRGRAHYWAFVIDLRRCDGCGDCTKACQQAYYLPKEQTWIKVFELKDAAGRTFYMPRPCMHCWNAPCVHVCPVVATYHTAEGLVVVDQNVCIGCRYCITACPYEARYFNEMSMPKVPTSGLPSQTPEFPVPQQHNTVGKCVLCAHWIETGKLPACVDKCTRRALYIADRFIDVATNGRDVVKLSRFLADNDAVRYKEELGTQPRVYYILGHGQDLRRHST